MLFYWKKVVSPNKIESGTNYGRFWVARQDTLVSLKMAQNEAIARYGSPSSSSYILSSMGKLEEANG